MVVKSAGLPNSSGGAVVVSSRRLCGLHVESCWHRDRTAIPGGRHGGSLLDASGRSSEAGCSVAFSEPPNQLETDLGSLWQDPDDDDFPSDSFAAQESFANMKVGRSPR